MRDVQRRRHVLICNWRDTRNPEGGGSERYVEQMARGLVADGDRVTIFCAAHDEAPPDESVDGIRFVRRGTKLAVYAHAWARLLLRRFGPVDLVIDVQNGIPFFTRLATRKPVVVVVHHVHREQWPIVYPGLTGRIGWWIESRLSPRLYRRSQYVAVSQATRDELVALGVSPTRVAVVHNGNDPIDAPPGPRSPDPSLVVVGRLVPHKRVEHAVDAVSALVGEFPRLHLHVLGGGWWHDELAGYVEASGVQAHVTLHGHVSEQVKHRTLADAWVLLLPSLKEGWGLVVGEAGAHGVPTVAYAAAGGTRESVVDGESGLLAADHADFIAAVGTVLRDEMLRARLSKGAYEMSRSFGWPNSQRSFATVLDAATRRRETDVVDPCEDRAARRGLSA
jgi:glycosyltransferase involved in cell wall biosynthesis